MVGLLQADKPEPRPVNVTDAIRAVADCLSHKLTSAGAKDVLFPTQTGVAVKDATEAIIMAAKYELEAHPDSVHFNSDFTNAYNTIERSDMLKAVRKYIPAASGLTEFIYGGDPIRIYYGPEHIILSKTGVQQGDNGAGLKWSLTAFEAITKPLQAAFPNVRIKQYHDDGLYSGSLESIKLLIAMLETKGPDHGIHINLNKCVLYRNDIEKLDDFPAQIKKTDQGFKLVGGAVGSDAFITALIGKKIKQKADEIQHIECLDNLQMEIKCLRFSTGSATITHLMRTTRPELIMDELQYFDTKVEAQLRRFMGTGLTEEKVAQLQLPQSSGGMGIVKASTIALPAYIGATVELAKTAAAILHLDSTEPLLQSIHAHLEQFNNKINLDQPVLLKDLEDQLKLQNFLTKLINVEKAKEVKTAAAANQYSLRLHDVHQQKHSTSFLYTCGARASERMPSLEFQTALKYFFGQQIYSDMDDDPYGRKPSRAHLVHRHNAVAGELHQVAREAGLHSTYDKAAGMVGKARLRPGDVTIQHYGPEGKHLCIDVTVISPFQQMDKTLDDVYDTAIREKEGHYQEHLRYANLKYVVFAMDSIGGMHKAASGIVKELASQWAVTMEVPISFAVGSIHRRIALALKKCQGNFLCEKIRLERAE